MTLQRLVPFYLLAVHEFLEHCSGSAKGARGGLLGEKLENRRECCLILLGYNGGRRFFVGEARRSDDMRMLRALGFQVFSETGNKYE